MSFRTIGRLAVVGVLSAGLACAGAEQEAGEEAGAGVAVPDTTAAALWAHLEGAGYAANWTLWPDKGQLYQGTEPHGMLLTTYLNELALDALTNKAGTMPAGAIVVKENYMPDSALAAVTVMYKAAVGYNPEHNDWFFLKRLADGTVEASGRVAGCQGCHAGVAANDYLFTGSLSQ
ncbi:MAG: hypothetical protein GTN62_04150 [Gemmatimonadales bacterium]|nr:hypothetical protein [Gemmatimonadales bacterium]NIN10504.1 hypothetical protein [Gemmatimonadales bacterium]NIN49291.1 hypothetical protein [Gemmatimonadales bacterium]NIP06755.1 hypothetical protein [Gemmatimonadales bacterium]NIR02781.1 hypothetical protein [Gemmatimonadales bacterium]